jgi:hypothetical protein
MLFALVFFSLFVVSDLVVARSPNLRILIKQMGSSIRKNLTETLPVETHVLIDPMVEDVVYYSYPILKTAKAKMLDDLRVERGSRSEKIELVKKYSQEAASQLLEELESRSKSTLLKRDFFIIHTVLSLALVVAGLYFVMYAINYLSSALNQATILDELYRAEWLYKD